MAQINALRALFCLFPPLGASHSRQSVGQSVGQSLLLLSLSSSSYFFSLLLSGSRYFHFPHNYFSPFSLFLFCCGACESLDCIQKAVRLWNGKWTEFMRLRWRWIRRRLSWARRMIWWMIHRRTLWCRGVRVTIALLFSTSRSLLEIFCPSISSIITSPASSDSWTLTLV